MEDINRSEYHWYPCFWLLVTFALGFKARVDPLRFTYIHVADRTQPLVGQHGGWASYALTFSSSSGIWTCAHSVRLIGALSEWAIEANFPKVTRHYKRNVQLYEAALRILCNTIAPQTFTQLLLFTASRNVAILGYVTFNISFFADLHIIYIPLAENELFGCCAGTIGRF